MFSGLSGGYDNVAHFLDSGVKAEVCRSIEQYGWMIVTISFVVCDAGFLVL